MSRAAIRFAALVCVLATVHAAPAQDADEVVEKSLAALGGRAALEKITNRSVSGTIAMETRLGTINGTFEMLNAVPNKTRSFIKADLLPVRIDQRFNGTAGYVNDSFQGERDVTGNQLENMKNGSFPHPFLDYKQRGAAAQLGGKERVGDRDAYVVILVPKSGTPMRQFIDVETYLPLKTAVTVETPRQGEVEQTTEFSDYRDVDGVKLPFRFKTASPAQTFTVTVSKVEHNITIDDALFSRPRQ